MSTLNPSLPTPRTPTRGWLGSKNKRRELLAAFLFLLPSVLGFLIFMIGPLLSSLGVSFLEWNLLTPPKWLGTANFVKLLSDEDFWSSLRATLYYILGSVPLGIVSSLALALALNQKLRGIAFYRTLYFIPVVSSMIAVALMWRWMYNPTAGILNYMLSAVFDFLHLRLTPPDWLQS